MSKRRKLLVPILTAAAIVIAVLIGPAFHLHPQPPRRVAQLLHFSHAMIAAVVLICLFSLIWDALAKDSAPTVSSESRASRGFHVIVLNLAVLLLILPVPGLTRRVLPASPILSALGLTIEIAGILFALWARRVLGANWSGEVRIATGHQLIRSGPYALIRHPIYTGVLAMYLGAAVVSGEVHAPIAFAVILTLYIRKLRLEEQILAANFGPAWADWRRHSWALLPPIL